VRTLRTAFRVRVARIVYSLVLKANDFHIVSAPLGPNGETIPNYMSTNGHRPFYSGLRKDQALLPEYWEVTSNDRYNSNKYHEIGPGKGRKLIVKLTIETSEYYLKRKYLSKK